MKEKRFEAYVPVRLTAEQVAWLDSKAGLNRGEVIRLLITQAMAGHHPDLVADTPVVREPSEEVVLAEAGGKVARRATKGATGGPQGGKEPAGPAPSSAAGAGSTPDAGQPSQPSQPGGHRHRRGELVGTNFEHGTQVKTYRCAVAGCDVTLGG